MHLRISTVLCCVILAGFATAAQSSSPDRGVYSDAIDIDDPEGSGGGTEVSRDLESSGSGFGPEDDEDTDAERPSIRKTIPTVLAPPPDEQTPKVDKEPELTHTDDGVIMNPKPEDRPTSFFAQPGILAAVIGGAVVGLLCAILVVMFIVYRMRKKDEGSYALDEPKDRRHQIRSAEEIKNSTLKGSVVLPNKNLNQWSASI